MILKERNVSSLNGLVLAGGKSRRMGRDKGLIPWHGKEQCYHLSDLLKNFCADVFISCRSEQINEFASGYKTLPDTFLNMGPYGGVLSALQAERDRAWLVVACDLPLLDEKTIQFLIAHRNPQTIATTYEGPSDKLPEPLVTIWEPKSYEVLLGFLKTERMSLRKALIESEKTILQPLYPEAFMSANTPEEAAKVEEILRKRVSL
jgi:molybdopterin-guanine dinucleotide biosynthesis protein A